MSLSLVIISLILLFAVAGDAFDYSPCKCHLGWDYEYIGSVKTGNCYIHDTNNELIDKIPDSFDVDIRALDMYGQSLIRLHENDIDRYEQLQVIELINCELEEIPTNFFKNNSHLVLISIRLNKLTKIQNYLFKNLSYLKRINLNVNNISIIEENGFFNLPALEKLFLNDNALKTLNFNFYDYKHLKYLHLDANPWICDSNLYELMNDVIRRKLWADSSVPTCSNIEGKRWDQFGNYAPLDPLFANKIIPEGEDLILECPIYNTKIVWSFKHNRGELYVSPNYNEMNKSSGISTMTLRKIRKWESGNYTCRVENCTWCHEASTYVSVVGKNLKNEDTSRDVEAAIPTVSMIQDRVCIGTNGRMSVPSNREHHYRNLKERYSNCTYVDGNLELTWLQDENLDLSFLHNIREVTGYVLISHVDVKRIVLPRLQIIRGRTLFKMNVRDEEFALIVALSKINYLEMPALRDTLQGSIGLFNNYNLCHVKTINWSEIISDPKGQYVYVYNFTSPERECPPCDSSCEAGCWGEGPENCQKFSKENCSPQCYQGRCFGPNPRECCHLFCAGGCTGPKQSDCLACRNFYDNGVCKQECPPMQRFNSITYSWEPNPNGKYAYGATCVKNCPEHLLKDNGACVRSCPPNKNAEKGECVLSNGRYPKTCPGVPIVHSGNIDDFKDCTIIEGSISIFDQSFKGYQEVFTNFSFGQHYEPMDPDRLQIFSTLKEVTGFINIQAVHDRFTNLSYFENLEVIGGRVLTDFFTSLYIVKTSLVSLGLKSLKQINAGTVVILDNKDLCFVQDINWEKIKKSSDHQPILQANKKRTECLQEGLVCTSHCSSDGCWGPSSDLCLNYI